LTIYEDRRKRRERRKSKREKKEQEREKKEQERGKDEKKWGKRAIPTSRKCTSAAALSPPRRTIDDP
jgi:hypothetical protein